MSRLQTQPATAADAPAVEQVARESWHAAYDDVLSEDTVDRVVDEWYALDRLRDAIERDEQIFVVATEGRDVLGFAHAGRSAEREHWNLFRLYVVPDRWGDGIGTTLIEQIEETLEDRGVATYELAVLAENDVGVAFYESRGFDRFKTEETVLAGVETTEYWYRKEL